MTILSKAKEIIGWIPKILCIGLIKFYRLVVSPLLPATCRFVPTCSEYSMAAFQKFGFLKGLYLTVRRLIRCRPGGGYGYDPVPETWDKRNER